MKETGTFVLDTDKKRLVLRTNSFRSEKGSVLHSGIFSRELASSFVAASVSVIFLIIIVFLYELRLVHYIGSAFVFLVVFPFSRILIFKEIYLESTFDRAEGVVSIILKRPFVHKVIKKSLSSLSDIRVSHMRFEFENPDGVAFVKKIALQHGTILPGFGQAEDYYNVVLLFGDQAYTILTCRVESDAAAVIRTIRQYIDEQNKAINNE